MLSCLLLKNTAQHKKFGVSRASSNVANEKLITFIQARQKSNPIG